jgi:tol-pal system protein YbgF
MFVERFEILSCIRRPLITVMSLALIGLSACVQPQRVELLEREQRRTQTDSAALQNELEATRSNLADTRASMQQLQREVSSLKEQLDETRHQVGQQINQSTRAGDQRVKDLEATVAKLTQALTAQEEQLKLRSDELKELRKGIQQHPSLPGEATEMSAAENETVRRDYESAWRALEKKDYRIAIGRFKDFLKRHPQSKLAASAQYWIGESHYALREFDRAIVEFDAVRSRYPDAEKVPAALLKQGFAFAELGEDANARLLLREIVEKYAQTPEAVQAKQKLKSLES